MNEEKAFYQNTPNNTMRVFIPKSKIERGSDAFMILDAMSIWGGFVLIQKADVDYKHHWGWEFSKDEHTHTQLHKLVNAYNNKR